MQITGIFCFFAYIASNNAPDKEIIPPVFVMLSAEINTLWHLCMKEET